MRYRKGITPVVAVVLLIAVTVAGAAVVYNSISGVQSQVTNQRPTLPISGDSVEFESCWGTPGDPSFTIRNTGGQAINVSEIPVRVNKSYLEATTDYTVSQSIVNPQSTFTINVNPGQPFNSETQISLILEEETVSDQCRNLN